MRPRDLPIDHDSASALAANGLRLDLVDGSDPDAVAAWDEADYRGFHDRRPEPANIDEHVRHGADRRILAVWDEGIAEPEVPVATVASRVGELTVPGGSSLDSWAISSVTVSPTHRRRGVARALLEGELRTAAAAGVPMASLTVSETTIYERYGFGPATQAAELTIDARRAGWMARASGSPASDGGPLALGFVSSQVVADTCRGIVDRARLVTPGELSIDDLSWGRLAGALGDRDNRSARLRAVRCDDASGTPQGVVVYSLKAHESDFTMHTVEIQYLRAATDQAYAALWRFLLELDLVATIRHEVASPDEAVVWMIRDQRAAKVVPYDHHWLRILDVRAALSARRYGAAGSLVLDVSDRLGFARGRYRLDTTGDGRPEVAETDEAPDVRLDVATLSALYLGGWRASTLARAGRVAQPTPGAIARLEAAFHSHEAPWLSYWY